MTCLSFLLFPSLPLSLFYLQLERIMSIYSSSSFYFILFFNFSSAKIGENPNIFPDQTSRTFFSYLFLKPIHNITVPTLTLWINKRKRRFRGKCSIPFQNFMTKIPIRYPIERCNIEVVLYGSLEFNTGYNCIRINM